jgi:hypothetical protein
MWDLVALLGGEVILSRAMWNRGASSQGGRGGRAGLRYGLFVYYGQLSSMLGGSDGYLGHPENTRGGVDWGTNVKGEDHALTSKGKPLSHWEVKTWYSTILLDCRYPQSRPEP